MNLTIAYCTYRKNPRIEWFYDSLNRILDKAVMPSLVVVDYHISERKLPDIPNSLRNKLKAFHHVAPKPSVWQGQHRITSENFFSASSARNTGLCYADPEDHIAYCDDLSVLKNTWLDPVLDVLGTRDIICGSFEKLKNMVVEKGIITRCEHDPKGKDFRYDLPPLTPEAQCSPSFLLGCCSAIPVMALLECNGWPELTCDGMGFEDCVTGMVLANNNKNGRFLYSRRMMEYECDEGHYEDKPFTRIDPGVSPDDKSHFVWDRMRNAQRFSQTFGNMDSIAALSESVRSGGDFPIPEGPTVEWFSGILLEDFHKYHTDLESCRTAVSLKTSIQL